MALTGGAFFVLMVLLTLALFVLVVAVLPRARFGARGVVTRAVAVLGLNASVLLLAGVVLNDSFDFYVSWSDLLGGSSATTTRTGASVRTAVLHKVSGPGFRQFRPATSSLPSLPEPGARLQTYSYRGPRSGLTGQILVYLPASYQQAGAAPQAYPVIEALHGIPGTPIGWVNGMKLPAITDSLVGQRRLAEPIIVMPQVNIPYTEDSECVNGPSGSPQAETWLAHDVPQFVLEHFRVRRVRSSWTTIGFSEGGWCAAMLTMLHSDVFGSGMVLGGYFRPEFASYDPFPRTSAALRRYDLVSLVARRPPAVALWVETSHKDPISYSSTTAVLRHSRPPMAVVAVVLKDAGHRVYVWRDEEPTALSWLGHDVPGFAPASGAAR